MSPSSGETIARVVEGDAAMADAAVQAAADASPRWAALPPAERAGFLRRLAALVADQRDELARVLSSDQGKPLFAEAYDEVDELGAYFSMAAEDATRLHGAVPASVSADRRVAVSRVPLGVVGVVTPWNWPYTMGAELFAPAMAAGNTVVWVPAPTTSACSGVLAELIAGSGLPPGVFNFVPGLGPVVGATVVGHPLVSGVGFIGSVATGSTVAARAAGKAQILELGGNGPMVVLADADLDQAAAGALEAAYLCAGQSCTAGERFLVEAPVVDAFVERVVELTRSTVRVGDPFDKATTMGPLNNEPTADKFDRHVSQAVGAGARLCFGGSRVRGLHERTQRGSGQGCAGGYGAANPTRCPWGERHCRRHHCESHRDYDHRHGRGSDEPDRVGYSRREAVLRCEGAAQQRIDRRETGGRAARVTRCAAGIFVQRFAEQQHGFPARHG